MQSSGRSIDSAVLNVLTLAPKYFSTCVILRKIAFQVMPLWLPLAFCQCYKCPLTFKGPDRSSQIKYLIHCFIQLDLSGPLKVKGHLQHQCFDKMPVVTVTVTTLIVLALAILALLYVCHFTLDCISIVVVTGILSKKIWHCKYPFISQGCDKSSKTIQWLQH